MLKKFLFIFLIFALFPLTACADTESTSAEVNASPATLGGMFCTADLPEGEVLTVSVSGDFFIADCIEDLLSFGVVSGRHRDYVVRVEILDEWVAWRNMTLPSQHEGALPFLEDDPGLDFSDDYRPSTFYRAQVLEAFLGEVEVGDILYIAQSGGRIGNVHFETDYFVPLALGEDLVLILSSPSWMTNEEWPATLISPFQSVYRFPSSSGDIRTFSLDEELEPYQPSERTAHFGLPLTLHDLAEMQRENFGEVSESFQEVLQQ